MSTNDQRTEYVATGEPAKDGDHLQYGDMVVGRISRVGLQYCIVDRPPWFPTSFSITMEFGGWTPVRPKPPEPVPHPWNERRDLIECGDRVTGIFDPDVKPERFAALFDADDEAWCREPGEQDRGCDVVLRVERIGPNGWHDVPEVSA